MLYMVIRYADNLPAGEYGVNDSYSLIGIFGKKEIAEKVKAEAEAAAEDRHEITMIPVKTNTVYPESKEIFLGGGWYIE